MRPSWDNYFMQICHIIKQRSTCIRRQVGAILVNNNQIIATGYNGAPSKMKHASEVGCLRDKYKVPSGEKHELCRGLHAEQNAIIQAALHGVSTDGATMYCTTKPCSICTKIILQAGIKEVIYNEEYNDSIAQDLRDEAKMSDIEIIWRKHENNTNNTI